MMLYFLFICYFMILNFYILIVFSYIYIELFFFLYLWFLLVTCITTFFKNIYFKQTIFFFFNVDSILIFTLKLKFLKATPFVMLI